VLAHEDSDAARQKMFELVVREKNASRFLTRDEPETDTAGISLEDEF